MKYLNVFVLLLLFYLPVSAYDVSKAKRHVEEAERYSALGDCQNATFHALMAVNVYQGYYEEAVEEEAIIPDPDKRVKSQIFRSYLHSAKILSDRISEQCEDLPPDGMAESYYLTSQDMILAGDYESAREYAMACYNLSSQEEDPISMGQAKALLDLIDERSRTYENATYHLKMARRYQGNALYPECVESADSARKMFIRVNDAGGKEAAREVHRICSDNIVVGESSRATLAGPPRTVPSKDRKTPADDVRPSFMRSLFDWLLGFF
ncbi:MAG: hypothetical protein GF416_05770 [Candidatus Altiarchaeales archaeon]|nr:hypothetical protein [Candidatus Altiarchaeales archaeon]MBD3416623.1 hypothetical protein [Candidatus Altiarchaeales archaeon]